MKSESTPYDTSTNGLAVGSSPAKASRQDLTSNGLEREVHNFFSDIEALLTSTTSLTGADLAAIKAKIGARLATAKASIEQMSGAVSQRTRRAVEATDAYAHEQPWKSIGIGAAIGVLVGFVLAVRRAR